jgi:hypothetical protein
MREPNLAVVPRTPVGMGREDCRDEPIGCGSLQEPVLVGLVVRGLKRHVDGPSALLTTMVGRKRGSKKLLEAKTTTSNSSRTALRAAGPDSSRPSTCGAEDV